jgi:hypothetical protein
MSRGKPCRSTSKASRALSRQRFGVTFNFGRARCRHVRAWMRKLFRRFVEPGRVRSGRFMELHLELQYIGPPKCSCGGRVRKGSLVHR